MERAIVLAKKAGIKVGCFFVIGLVGETKQDITESIHYAYKLRKLGADRFYFSIAMPMYGTELYEQAKSKGYLKADFSDDTLAETQPLIETPEFTAQEIMELGMQANAINRQVTSDKIATAIKDPKKALRYLMSRM